MALRDVLAALVPAPQVMPAVPPPVPNGGMGFPLPSSYGMGFTEVAGEWKPRGRTDVPEAVPRMREGGFGGGGGGPFEKVPTFDPWGGRTGYVNRPTVPAQAEAENPRAVIGSNSGAPITRTTTGGNLSGIKYRIPLEEMQAGVVPSGPMLSRPLVTPESLYRDRSLIMGAVGDKTAAGVTLVNIGGQPLATKVPLYGGPGYMQGPSQQADQSIWAASKGKIATMGNKAQEASAKEGRPVDLIYTAMGGTSADYSTMMSDALVAQLPGAPISSETAEAFDAAMRGNGKGQGKIPGWPGLNDPALSSFLRANSKARIAFAEMAGKGQYQDNGFPDIGQTRFAITEPELVHAPTGTTGFSLGRLDPDNPWVTDPTAFHPSYASTGLRGTNSGQMDMAYPRELIWSDWYKMARADPKLTARNNPNDIDYAFERQLPIQRANDQWLDQIKQYQELMKIRGY